MDTSRNVYGNPARDVFSAQRRVLYRSTRGDRGIVEVPVLTPHLEARPLDAETVMLISETFSSLLHGQCYLDLLPLLDGTRSRHDVAAALAGRYTALQTQTALVSLATRGYVVSNEFDMSREMAAFWCSLGVSPRYAEEHLRAARVVLAGDGAGGTEPLAAALGEMGLVPCAPVDEPEPTLTVIMTDDYLHESHAETNRGGLAARGGAWTLVKTVGVWPLFGPVFRPADGGDVPCWGCLAHRLRGNREVESFFRTVVGDTVAIRPRALAPPFANAICGLAATEIAKWVVLGELAPIHRDAISLDVFTVAGEAHRVMRRPQCFACGDPGLHRPDRDDTPVRLRPSPKPVRNSGGLRSVPPEETVRKYRHLVSPISGVVTQLMRISDEADPWMHVCWAGSNLALKSDNIRTLRSSLRTKSSGKGSTAEQSQASALCEALERYSGVFHGDEIRRRARLEDFADGEALHPNEVQLFSEWQHENADRINALGARFNFVPSRFDPCAEMDWTPVWSLTAERRRYLPTSMLYFSMPVQDGVLYAPPDSNGCAAGNTLEEAILQGFFELVERDAFACWWYNAVSLPEMDLDSFGDPYLASAREYYAAHRRDLWLLDATHDLGIPAFVAVSRRNDKAVEDIIYASGAHFDPRIAALRTVCELNQYFHAIVDVDDEGNGYLYDDPMSLAWWQNATLAGYPYLAPDRGAPVRRASRYQAPETEDVREDVELCRALVESRGMEFLVLDQTRPDIGLPVARTIVPGLRHFWARFAPGRLYDVPLAMGWVDALTAEADLNPEAVLI